MKQFFYHLDKEGKELLKIAVKGDYDSAEISVENTVLFGFQNRAAFFKGRICQLSDGRKLQVELNSSSWASKIVEEWIEVSINGEKLAEVRGADSQKELDHVALYFCFFGLVHFIGVLMTYVQSIFMGGLMLVLTLAAVGLVYELKQKKLKLFMYMGVEFCILSLFAIILTHDFKRVCAILSCLLLIWEVFRLVFGKGIKNYKPNFQILLLPIILGIAFHFLVPKTSLFQGIMISFIPLWLIAQLKNLHKTLKNDVKKREAFEQKFVMIEENGATEIAVK